MQGREPPPRNGSLRSGKRGKPWVEEAIALARREAIGRRGPVRDGNPPESQYTPRAQQRGVPVLRDRDHFRGVVAVPVHVPLPSQDDYETTENGQSSRFDSRQLDLIRRYSNHALGILLDTRDEKASTRGGASRQSPKRHL